MKTLLIIAFVAALLLIGCCGFVPKPQPAQPSESYLPPTPSEVPQAATEPPSAPAEAPPTVQAAPVRLNLLSIAIVPIIYYKGQPVYNLSSENRTKPCYLSAAAVPAGSRLYTVTVTYTNADKRAHAISYNQIQMIDADGRSFTASGFSFPSADPYSDCTDYDIMGGRVSLNPTYTSEAYKSLFRLPEGSVPKKLAYDVDGERHEAG